MDVIVGTTAELPDGLYAKTANYRHRVFIEKLGWRLQSFAKAEQDQFDREDTVYVVAINPQDDIIGCARLLQTTQPYLLSEVFPHLLNGMPPPNSADIWELSRFASVDFSRKTTSSLRRFSSSGTVQLLRASLAYASGRGAKRIITVSPLGVERLLKLAGFNAPRIGPPHLIDGKPIFACWIETQR